MGVVDFMAAGDSLEEVSEVAEVALAAARWVVGCAPVDLAVAVLAEEDLNEAAWVVVGLILADSTAEDLEGRELEAAVSIEVAWAKVVSMAAG